MPNSHIKRLIAALKEMEDWEVKGETLSDAYDSVHGKGKWEKLLSVEIV